MKLFATLRKIEEADDGTLEISGIASSEDTDSAGEIVLASAIKAALPDFMQDGSGPLREMHQNVAAGTVQKVTIDAMNRTVISAIVVDPIAIRKIKTNTYRGFSIGGKVLERDADDRKIITKIKLSEISLVDRPANPSAVFDLWKADGLTGHRFMDPAAQAEAAVARLVAAVDDLKRGFALVDRTFTPRRGAYLGRDS
jgi:hypothetical protein